MRNTDLLNNAIRAVPCQLGEVRRRLPHEGDGKSPRAMDDGEHDFHPGSGVLWREEDHAGKDGD